MDIEDTDFQINEDGEWDLSDVDPWEDWEDDHE